MVVDMCIHYSIILCGVQSTERITSHKIEIAEGTNWDRKEFVWKIEHFKR